MQYPFRFGTTAGFMFGVGLTALLALQAPAVRADDAMKPIVAAEPAAAPKAATAKPAVQKPAVQKPAAQKTAALNPVAHAKKTVAAATTKKVYARSIPHVYFVEFRARNAASYGHMYVLYGRVNAHQEIVESHIAGFFPAGDTRDCANCSVFNWTIGHLIFVPSELGASDGDLEEKYVLARYRVWVTKAEYDKVVAYIKDQEAHKPLWNALWKNCVDFGRDVAEFMNLKVPLFIWIEPKDFITALREANGVMVEQKPLKDAASGLYAPVRSASQTPLPPQKPAAEKKPMKPSAAAKPALSTAVAKPAQSTAAAKPAQTAMASKPAHPKPKKQPVAEKPASQSPEQAMAWSAEAH
jgi:hypothetical protein